MLKLGSQVGDNTYVEVKVEQARLCTCSPRYDAPVRLYRTALDRPQFSHTHKPVR